MKFSKTLKKIIFGTVGTCIAAALFVTPLTISNTNVFADSTDPIFSADDAKLSVVAYDKNGNTLSGIAGTATANEVSYNTIQQNWEDLSYFKISYDKSELPEETQFSYSYGVTFSQVNVIGGKIDLKTDHTYIKTITTKTAESKNKINDIYFYVSGDINTTGEQNFQANTVLGTDDMSYSDINGRNKINIYGSWGVYQFSFTYNSLSSSETPTTKSSKLVEVVPTDATTISAPLTFSYKEKSSKYSISSAYYCKINCTAEEGSDSWRYAYVDRSKLIWKVEGTSAKGDNYVLLPSDIPTNDRTTKSILNAYDNSGFDFLLDFDIAGTWEVTCSATNTTKVSEELTFSTVKVYSSVTIIIIVIVCVLVAAGVLTFILVRSKKKEKIW